MTRGRPMFGAVNGDWQQCPPGELGRLADRLRARRWGLALLGAGAALLVATAVAFSAWQVAAVFGPSSGPGTPACSGTGCSATTPAASCHGTAP